MKAVICGASGFIGSSLARHLSAKGACVTAVTRGDLSLADEGLSAKLAGADALVNLSGAPVDARWSESYKKEMYSSRVETTAKLVRAMASLPPGSRPGLFISASAVGIYAPGECHDESSSRYGEGFLAALCSDWEARASLARASGVRTAIFRLGVVLDKSGGALRKMLPPFSLGLGGAIGGGGQYMSWITLSDLLRAFDFVIGNARLNGVFNLCTPNPVTNAEFTAALARALNRPAFLRVPEFAVKAIFGEGASVLCEGARVYPARLAEAGFVFEHPGIEKAIASAIAGR